MSAQLTGLLAASAARWPGVRRRAGRGERHRLGYRTEGTLIVGLTGDDLAEAAPALGVPAGVGTAGHAAAPRELRDREPALSPRVRGGALRARRPPGRPAPGGGGAAPAAGGPARSSCPGGSRDAVRGGRRGRPWSRAGCGTAALTGLPVRPVKGQVLRLRAPSAAPASGTCSGGTPTAARLPGAPGRRRDRGRRDRRRSARTPTVTAGGGARRCCAPPSTWCPSWPSTSWSRRSSGIAPGTPDNAPLLGPLPDGRACSSPPGTTGNGVAAHPGHRRPDRRAGASTGVPIRCSRTSRPGGSR